MMMVLDKYMASLSSGFLLGKGRMKTILLLGNPSHSHYKRYSCIIEGLELRQIP